MKDTFKFAVGDKVKKIKGYKFEGRIISRGYKLDAERILYSVEVEKFVNNICANCGLDDTVEQNCGGMVHIFAESDLELI